MGNFHEQCRRAARLCAAGRRDATADYLSKRTGQTTKEILTWSQESKPGEQTASGNIGMTQTPLPLMLPQDLRNMDMGYFVLFSHKTKGTIRGYAYDPGDLMRKAAGVAA